MRRRLPNEAACSGSRWTAVPVQGGADTGCAAVQRTAAGGTSRMWHSRPPAGVGGAAVPHFFNGLLVDPLHVAGVSGVVIAPVAVE